MVDGHILSQISKWKSHVARKTRPDDDFADRFNHALTSGILLVFTVAISARQYMGSKPIACWVPSEFTSAQEEYAEDYCWVASTYFLPSTVKQVPTSIQQRRNSKILYYQWVPFLFLIQALMFTMPCLFWRLLSWQTGIHLSTIIELATDIESIRDCELRQVSLSYVSKYIDQSLKQHKVINAKDHSLITKCKNCFSKITCLWFSKRYGSYLTSIYFGTKILYMVNIIGQFFLMKEFLGSDYRFYGLELLRHLITGYDWEESGNFPRVTLCDFEVRKFANFHRYTVQCVLPINLFNEKIFLFLWFWFVLVACVTIASFFSWISKLSFEASRIHYIRKFLKLKCLIGPSDMKISIDFTCNYLKQDGVLIFQLMSQNIGELITSEIIERIWRQYRGVNYQSEVITNKQFNTTNKRQSYGNMSYLNMAECSQLNNMHPYSIVRRRDSSKLVENLEKSQLPSRNLSSAFAPHIVSSSSSSPHSMDTARQQQQLQQPSSQQQQQRKTSSISNGRRAKRKNNFANSSDNSNISGEKSKLSLDNLEEDPGEFV